MDRRRRPRWVGRCEDVEPRPRSTSGKGNWNVDAVPTDDEPALLPPHLAAFYEAFAAAAPQWRLDAVLAACGGDVELAAHQLLAGAAPAALAATSDDEDWEDVASEDWSAVSSEWSVVPAGGDSYFRGADIP